MKTIEISDEAHKLLQGLANTYANGNTVKYLDRLIGVKERSLYEKLLESLEHEVLKTYNPDKMSNAEFMCAILEIIWKNHPQRFQNLDGFLFPDKSKRVISQDIKLLGDQKYVRPIGNSGFWCFVGFDYLKLRGLLREILTIIGYKNNSYSSLHVYIKKSGEFREEIDLSAFY